MYAIYACCIRNSKYSYYGLAIVNTAGKILFQESGTYTTPDTAEYSVLLKALNEAASIGIKKATIFISNKLVVKQANGLKKTNIPGVKELLKKINTIKSNFNSLEIQYVEKQKNKAFNIAKNVIKKNNTRKAKAEKLIKNVFIKSGHNYIFINNDKQYLINPQKPSCTCPDQQIRGGLCKHLMAVKIIGEKISNNKMEVI